MASVTTDAHSLMIDGRRIFLSCVEVESARFDAGEWRDRLRAARELGANTVETSAVWSMHEPAAGSFDFSGRLDLARFVRMAGEFGLRTVLRVGPYIGSAWDAGGVPPWVVRGSGGRTRLAEADFLRACASWYAALADQVAELQATRSGAPGIVAVQCEHQWFCGDEEQGDAYLGTLMRYLREVGFSVPVLGVNNLYHQVEGELSAWAGADRLFEHARQMRVVRPDHPALMWGVPVVPERAIDGRSVATPSPVSAARRVLQVLAGGGQFNLTRLAAGVTPAFHEGTVEDHPGRHAGATPSPDAPVSVEGERGEAYWALRRVVHFAGAFERVLSALDAEQAPTALAPDAVGAVVGDAASLEAGRREPSGGNGPVVVERRGPQGSAIFVLADEDARKRRGDVPLVLPDGTRLSVPVGELGAAWLLRDAHLAGRAVLDYCNACPFAIVGQVFVCFAPAGSLVALSINGSPVEFETPKKGRAHIATHEGVTIVLCNEKQIDRVFADAKGVYLDASGFDESGAPLGAGRGKVTRVDPSGGIETLSGAAPPRGPGNGKLSGWSTASAEAYVDGTHERYAMIDGPAPLEDLGVPRGYAWVRLAFKSTSQRTAKVGLFQCADRAHLFADGKPAALAGRGPGAEGDVCKLALKRGERKVVLLLDNLGRAVGADGSVEPRGIWGPLHEVAPVKHGAVKVESGPSLVPLAQRTPIFGLDRFSATSTDRLTWSFKHLKQTPLFFSLHDAPSHGLVLLNDEVIGVLTPGADTRIELPREPLKRGANALQLALVHEDPKALLGEIRGRSGLYEGVKDLSEKWSWSLAVWEAPSGGAFEEVAAGKLGGRGASSWRGLPRWWRATFRWEGGATPAVVPEGLSKGVVLLNGEPVARFALADGEGKAYAEATPIALPASLLGEENELTIFDEHGFAPGKVSLRYGPPRSR